MVFSDVLEIHTEAWLWESLEKIVELYIKKKQNKKPRKKPQVFYVGLKR